MDNAYQNALGTVADTYEAAVAEHGGKSLARVATIVVSSGAFFTRLREGKTFHVHNLEKFAAWFRDPANWPNLCIPHDAAIALTSIGRPPIADMQHSYRTGAAHVASNAGIAFDRNRA
nr:hypothetical protein GCM10017606_29630 [Microbacterium terregens]